MKGIGFGLSGKGARFLYRVGLEIGLDGQSHTGVSLEFS